MNPSKVGSKLGRRASAAARALGDAPRDYLGPQDASDLAAYIAQLASEMAQLADEARLDVLAYLLSMAVNEAAGLARASGPALRPDADD